VSELPDRPVRRASWGRLTTDDLYGIVRLRNRVFALEQRVSAEDFDGRDREPGTEHWWFGADAPTDGPDPDPTAVTGYLRLVRPAVDEPHPGGAAAPTRVVGRVATAPEHRGRGIASALLAAVVAEHGGVPMVLHAQEYVAALYERHGFVRFGAPYEEAGIRHVGMYRAGAVRTTP
jgi:ElaA protein